MIEVSQKMKEYFDNMDKKIKEAYDVANKARAQGLDPDTKTEIPLSPG